MICMTFARSLSDGFYLDPIETTVFVQYLASCQSCAAVRAPSDALIAR